MGTPQKSESGAALMIALIVALATSMFVGAAVIRGLSSYGLAWNQTRSESALLLAEGGVNDELTYIAANTGASSNNQLSSQPTVQTGTTQTYPGETHEVYGRQGTVNGDSSGNYWVCSSNNEWWHSGATPVAWDGVTSPFYITATSLVNGNWRRVEVQASPLSAFSQGGQIGLFNGSNSSTVTVNDGSTVSVSGTSITNGSVSCGQNGSYKSTHCQNANTNGCSGGQFTSGNCNSGSNSDLYTKPTPYTYPTCSTVVQNTCGTNWNGMSGGTHSSNGSNCYTYSPTGTSCNLSPSNCVHVTCSTTLDDTAWNNCNGHPGTNANCSGASMSCNYTGGRGNPYTVTVACNNHPFTPGQTFTVSGCTGSWSGCNGSHTVSACTSNTVQFTCNRSYNGSGSCQMTDTVNHVKTLIFEPGDYYFDSCQLNYVATHECVIDNLALASGGTPGQVRFWINDPTNPFWYWFGYSNSDHCDLPISHSVYGSYMPVACVGTPSLTPDPSQFRIYYNGDGSCFTFNRPSGCTDYNGQTLLGDFNHYCGVYACTKQTGDNSSLVGSRVACSGSSDGASTINGALLADNIQYNGACKINFVTSNCATDPGAGTGVSGGYSCDQGR